MSVSIDYLIKSPIRLLGLVALLVFGSQSVAQADPQVRIYFNDGAGLPGDSNVAIEVLLDNYSDSVAAFELWFKLDRPGVANLQLSVDTTKTLIAGWDYLDIRAVDSAGYDVKVSSVCDVIPPFTKRGFGPQTGGSVPLFRLLSAIPQNPDPFADEADVDCIPDIENFGLSTPSGHSIGISFRPALDTSYYNCVSMAGDSCLEWEEVPGPPADSMSIEVYQQAYVDTTKVTLVEGAVHIAPEVCGDIDGSLDGLVTLADLSRMIDLLFISLRPLQIPALGNTDGSVDGEITLSDLSRLIDNLFVNFQPLDCNL